MAVSDTPLAVRAGNCGRSQLAVHHTQHNILSPTNSLIIDNRLADWLTYVVGERGNSFRSGCQHCQGCTTTIAQLPGSLHATERRSVTSRLVLLEHSSGNGSRSIGRVRHTNWMQVIQQCNPHPLVKARFTGVLTTCWVQPHFRNVLRLRENNVKSDAYAPPHPSPQHLKHVFGHLNIHSSWTAAAATAVQSALGSVLH